MSELETIQGNKQLDAPKNKKKKPSKARRVWGIIGLSILTALFVLLLLNAMLNIFMPHYYPTFGKYRFFAVVSDSMEPEIPTGNMIMDETPRSPEDIQVGTVITFEVADAKGNITVLTHRVVEIKTINEKTVYVTKGDNAPAVDSIVPEYSDIIGIYTGRQCGFFGYFFGFMQSESGAIFLFIVLFIVFIVWMLFLYIDNRERRHIQETAALKKSAQALSSVNLRYDNIREITAVMDVLGMVTDDTEKLSERREIERRLDAFIDAETIELPQTPETAAILDSLPAPDTPMSLASALRSGATLRQAEDGQTLILTGLSGGKSILLTPVQTEDGIILCQQGVRLRADIAPNIESVGATSMPDYPEFFEGQPLKKNVEYPELPASKSNKIGAEMLSPHSSVISQEGGVDNSTIAALSAPKPIEGRSTLAEIDVENEVHGLPASSNGESSERQSAPLDPENYKAKVAYAQYREAAAQLELRQTEQLHSLLDEVKPLSPEEQAAIDAFKAAEKAAKPKKKAVKHKTPEQLAEQRARSEQRKAEQEAFINALSPADRELYLAEQRLSKSRAATIRRLKRIEKDRKILEKLK